MFCPQCGTQLPEGAGFCPSCGASQSVAKSAAGSGAGAGRRPPTTLITLTTVLLAAAIAVALLLVWRSGGNGGGEIAGVRPVVVSSEPVPLPPGPTCVLPSSFQFVSEWQLEAPDLRSLVGEDAAEVFGPALDGVSVSGRADGTFDAPGSVWMQVGTEDVVVDLAVLPDGMEVQVPGTGQRYEGDSSEDEVLFGQEICSDLIEGLQSLNVQATREEVGGIPAFHVRLDEGAFRDLAVLLDDVDVDWDYWGNIYYGGPPIPDSLAELAMSTERLTLDVWLAQDGLWPVRIESDGTWYIEDFGEIRLQLSYQWKPDGAPVHD